MSKLQKNINFIDYQIIKIYTNIKKINRMQITTLLLGYFYSSATQIFFILSEQYEKSLLNFILTPISYLLKKYTFFHFILIFPKKSFIFFQQLIEGINLINLIFNWKKNINEKKNKEAKNLLFKMLINFYYNYKLIKRGILLGIFIEAFKLGS